MAPRKTERILNLTICLLVSGRYLPKSRIREAVEGYNLSDAAFERTFERDKDELRSLGVPIEVGSFDPLFDDEPGYRILSSEFALPAIDLDAEAAVVGVAARVWRHASMAEATRSAIAKLRAAGVEPDASQLPWSHPFGHRSRALRCCGTPCSTAVSFTYRDGNPRTRTVGFDLVQGTLVRDRSRCGPGGHPDVQAVADGRSPQEGSELGRMRCRPTDLRRLARSLAPREPTETAVLAIRAGKAPGLARRGEPATSNVKLPAGFAVYASASVISTQPPRRSPSTPPMLWCSSPPSCGSWSSAA